MNQFAKLSRRQLLAVPLASLLGQPLRAQTSYPDKPVTLVVPFAAGGFVDAIARGLAARLQTQLGQSVTVENRVGASGNIGAAYVAKAKPDGHTLLVAFDSFAANPHLYKLTFDSEAEFAPVALVGAAPLLLVVNPQVPASNVNEFIALAKAKGGGLAFASTGAGSSNHLAMELLKRSANVDFVHVPYKGGAPALTDLIGGQVQAMFPAAGSALQFVKSGKIKAIGVSTRTRMRALPDVPPVAQDLPGFDMASWIGVFAPAQTPTAIVTRINSEIHQALRQTEMQKILDDQVVETRELNPTAFGQFVKAESQKVGELIRRQGIRVE